MREVTGAEHDLATLFAPRSVAVIGASGRPGALSWWPVHLLDRYGFKGEVYPVNPSARRDRRAPSATPRWPRSPDRSTSP